MQTDCIAEQSLADIRMILGTRPPPPARSACHNLLGGATRGVSPSLPRRRTRERAAVWLGPCNAGPHWDSVRPVWVWEVLLGKGCYHRCLSTTSGCSGGGEGLVEGEPDSGASGDNRCSVRKAWAAATGMTWWCQPGQERPLKWYRSKPRLSSRYTPHVAMPSSGGSQVGGERGVFVEQLAVLKAAAELSDHAVDKVALGNRVPVTMLTSSSSPVAGDGAGGGAERGAGPQVASVVEAVVPHPAPCDGGLLARGPRDGREAGVCLQSVRVYESGAVVPDLGENPGGELGAEPGQAQHYLGVRVPRERLFHRLREVPGGGADGLQLGEQGEHLLAERIFDQWRLVSPVGAEDVPGPLRRMPRRRRRA